MMKKLMLILLCAGMMETSQAITPGFDWQIGRSTGTIQGRGKCADWTFYYVNGQEVPRADIVCCDFNNQGFVTGGINCPYGIPVNPPKRIDITKNYSINQYFGNDLKVALNRETGNIEVVNYTNKLSLVLLTRAQMLGDSPVNIMVNITNGIIDVMYCNISNGMIPVEDNGTYIHRYFNVEEVTADLYKSNLFNIVSLHPNPASFGTPFNMKNLLHAYGDKISVSFYTFTGTPAGTFMLPMENNYAMLGAGNYRAIVIFNGIQINRAINFIVIAPPVGE